MIYRLASSADDLGSRSTLVLRDMLELLWAHTLNWLRPRESNAVSLGYESRMVFRSTLPLVHNISRLSDVGNYFWLLTGELRVLSEDHLYLVSLV